MMDDPELWTRLIEEAGPWAAAMALIWWRLERVERGVVGLRRQLFASMDRIHADLLALRERVVRLEVIAGTDPARLDLDPDPDTGD